MSINRRIAFGAAASWFSRGISISLGMLLLPVLFRNLPQSELGMWLLLGQSWAVLGIFDLGFGVTLTRRIAFAVGKGSTDMEVPLVSESLKEVADLVATGRRIYHAVAILTFLCSLAAGFFYLRSLDLGGVSTGRVWIAWGILCLSQAVGIRAAVWNCLLQGVGYVGWDAILASMINALTLMGQIISALLGGGLVSLAVIAACGVLGQRCAILGFARKRRPEVFNLRGNWDPLVVKSMAPVAIRVWLTALGGLLISNSDQFFIASMEGAEALPSYRAAFLLVLNLHLLAGAVSGASNVFVSHLWQAGNVEQIREILRRNALIGLLAISCGGAAILGMGADLFDFWLGYGHYVGNQIVLIFLVTFLLDHHATVFSTCSRATNDEAYTWSSLIAGGMKIGLALWLTRALGLVGLALATLIAQTATNNW
jgi:O-antigen/teichoic acid export membrane protein